MEVWKFFTADYQISDLGNVKSFKRGRERLLTPMVVADGYVQVQLRINGKSKKFLVHRLVAIAFVPNPENKPYVNHINGDKHDNRAENLEWCTQTENIRHAVLSGLIKQGADSADAILSTEQAEWIRNVYVPRDSEFGQSALARKFGVSKDVIQRVVHGFRYRNAGGKIHDKFDSRVPDNVRDEICRLYKKGVRGCGSTTLARQFGLGKTTIKRILKEHHPKKNANS